MKTRIIRNRAVFFVPYGTVFSLGHMVLLTYLSAGGIPLTQLLWPHSFAAGSPALGVLTTPANFLLASSWFWSLPPISSTLLLTANSLLWGFCFGAIIFWWRLRHEMSKCRTMRFT